MLVSQTLFGTIDKVKIAIDRLREFEPPEGYYLAFSGGKDSQTVYHLAKEAGVRFDAHYNLTTVDPPELVYHIRENYPDVQVHRPEKTMWELIIKDGGPPTRRFRYCCKTLKEPGGEGRLVLTGVRWEESTRRAGRRMVENCQQGILKQFLHPIIDWTEKEVWAYIESRGIKYCSLYDEGWDRIGCIGCPMGGARGMAEDFKRYPKFKEQYLRTFAKMLERRKERGRKEVWEAPEEVMRWWIYGSEKVSGLPDQTVMFE